MELLLLGWSLGLVTAMAHQQFVVKPKLKKIIAELNDIKYDLKRRPRKLADALRALDSQLGYEVLGVRCVDCSQLQLIAAELEAQP